MTKQQKSVSLHRGKEKQKARAAARAKSIVKRATASGPSTKSSDTSTASTAMLTPLRTEPELRASQKTEIARWNASIWAGVGSDGNLQVVRLPPVSAALSDQFFQMLGMAAFSSMEARAVGKAAKEGNRVRPQGHTAARRILQSLEESIEAMRTTNPDVCEYVLEVLNVDK